MRRGLVLVGMTVFLLVVACDTTGRTIYVDDDGPADFNNIQAGIDDANDGDIIEVQPGRYTGSGNRDIDPNGKAITIRSIEPNDPCIVAGTIIDCNGIEAEPHRGFYFHSNEGVNSALEGLTIINGYMSLGGAIYCSGGTTTILNCIIKENVAGEGGGIWGHSCNLTIADSTIIDNSTYQYGGGGVNCYESNVTIDKSFIVGNTSPYEGGGIKVYRESTLYVRNCSVTDNNSQIGGGVYFGGGTPFGNDSAAYIKRSTLWGNYANYEGGGFQLNHADATVENSIFWGNTSPSGAAISVQSIWSISHLTVTYSDIDGGCNSIHVDPCNVFLWDNSNVDADPCFVDAFDGDYHLKSEGWRWDMQRKVWTWDDVTSRCVDAGNPSCPLGGELLSAPDDPDNEWGENLRINMGAYGGTAEASMPPYDWALLANLTNDGKVDSNDLAAFVDYWLDSGECIPSDLNRDQFVNFIDFILLAEDWFETTSWY